MLLLEPWWKPVLRIVVHTPVLFCNALDALSDEFQIPFGDGNGDPHGLGRMDDEGLLGAILNDLKTALDAGFEGFAGRSDGRVKFRDALPMSLRREIKQAGNRFGNGGELVGGALL